MSRPLRLAVYHNLPSGGAKRTLRAQVAGLTGRGHTVDVFVPATAEETAWPLAEVASSLTVVPHAPPPGREAALAGRLTPGEALRWLRFLLSLRALESAIAGEIDARGYDVVLVHPSQFTQAPWTLAALRTPSLYYCHEPLRAAYEPGIATPPVRLALRLTLGPIDRRGVRAATAVAANSAFTAASVRRIYGRAARVLYPGVDLDAFTPGFDPGARGDYLLAVGALHPLKAADFLVRALARLPAAARPPLRIVADRARDAERRRIEELAHAAGVRIDIATQVGEEELVKSYRGSRLVLCAAHREPFGLVPIEAMACGRPVLAVRDGGFPETVVDGKTGFLEERDESRFAERIAAILADVPAAEVVGARAANLARERWGWPRAIDELEETLTGLARAAARDHLTAAAQVSQ